MVNYEKVEDYHPLLFNLGLDLEFSLNANNNVCKELIRAFKYNGKALPRDARIVTCTEGRKWEIVDRNRIARYVIVKKTNRLDIYENRHVVNEIVDRDLCVRCGACEPACPVDIIKFNEQAYPYITEEQLCITSCTRCLKVCPGEVVDLSMLDKQMFGVQPHPDSITGIARKAMVSYATDPQIRYAGTSGGFVTQLFLYMLERKIIDGALVLGTSANNGGWRQESFIARSGEELKSAIKSKYMAVPFLRPLKEMEEIEGNYAVVALPCYIHALRKYQKISKKLRERVKLVVGLYCNVVFEPHLFDDVCEFNNIAKENVSNFHFRYGEWPGGVVAELRDGSEKKMLKHEEMKDQFNLLKLFYTAPRCNTCVDFSAEYADIAVGDPWLRGPDGKYLFEDGRTTVLVRTKSGDDIVDMASRDGYVNVKEIGLKTYMVNFEKSGRYKRDFVPKNIMLRRLFRLSFPMYNRAIGVGKLSGFVPMLLRTCILSISRYKWFRRMSLRVCQTRPVIAFFAWNRGRKERNFASSYMRMERFVETLYHIKPPAGDCVDSRTIEDDQIA